MRAILLAATVLWVGGSIAGCARSEPASPDTPAAAGVGAEVNAPAPNPLAPLDPSDPAQAAIAEWHRSLVENDLDAYAAVTPSKPAGSAGETVDRSWFDAMREGVPSTVLASDGTGKFNDLVPEEDRALVASLRTFTLVGCAEAPEGAGSSRRVASVSARQLEGEWKVFGGSFGPANEWYRGGCPVEPAP